MNASCLEPPFVSLALMLTSKYGFGSLTGSGQSLRPFTPSFFGVMVIPSGISEGVTGELTAVSCQYSLLALPACPEIPMLYVPESLLVPTVPSARLEAFK